MIERTSRLAGSGLAIFLVAVLGRGAAAVPSSAGGVIRVVDRPNLGAFTSLQAAVDAAPDGGLLLFESGDYDAAVVSGKSLSLVEMPGADARLVGTLRVRRLGPEQRVFLSGIEARAGGLRLEGNLGHVRVESCAFLGTPAVDVANSARVLLVDCRLRGSDASAPAGFPGEDGSSALATFASAVALYDCELEGGRGADEGFPGGSGGTAAVIVGGGMFASRTSFLGGAGGTGDGITCGDGGVGGAGLDGQGALLHVLDATFAGGLGGQSFCGAPGASGPTITPTSTVNPLAGSGRTMRATGLAPEASSISLVVDGQPGDRVYLLASGVPAFTFSNALRGVNGVSSPVLSSALPLGVIPVGGSLVLQAQLPAVGPPRTHGAWYVQAVAVDTAGQATLSTPLALERLKRAGNPDCDGNGVSDFADLLLQPGSDCNRNLVLDSCDIASLTDPDCQGNGVPDSCDIASGFALDCDSDGVPDDCALASGAAADCNANAIPDACDIAAGTSLDGNGNGIPDECEPHQPQTLWVDPNAAPGGSGSPTSPFASLQEAFAAAFHGDTLILRDGVYSGPGNRNLDPNGLELTVRGEHGAAAAILDCQQAGRAFAILGNTGPGFRLEGLTIRNGNAAAAAHSTSFGGGVYVVNAAPAIVDCVFEDCSGAFGAGLAALGSRLEVRGCRFENCRVPAGAPDGRGGGMYLTPAAPGGAAPRIVDTTFEACLSRSGGGLYCSAIEEVVLSHCRFLGNAATNSGGAAVLQSFQPFTSPRFRILDCLFANNLALRGGALWARAETTSGAEPLVAALDCTFADNDGAWEGGALYVSSPNAGGLAVELGNSILWRNHAGLGASVFQTGGPTVVSLRSSCVEGGPSSAQLAPSSTLTWDPRNLAVDPAFVSPDGPDGDPATWADNDHRLLAGSPCVDYGENAIVPGDAGDIDADGDRSETLPWDLDRLTRFVDLPGVPDQGLGTPPLVDLGAFERRP